LTRSGWRNHEFSLTWVLPDVVQRSTNAGVRQLRQPIASIIVGKDLQIRQSLTCLLAGGHLLIEDAPGVGKTTLAHAISMSLGLPFRRIQFTSDLLHPDVIGVSVYDRNSGQFVFHRDRYSRRCCWPTRSIGQPEDAERLARGDGGKPGIVDGLARPLPQPFFVIANANPFHQVGTFPLPESQLDRFLMCISLGIRIGPPSASCWPANRGAIC